MLKEKKKARTKITRFNLDDEDTPEITKEDAIHRSYCWVEVKGNNPVQKLNACLPRMSRREKCAGNIHVDKILKRSTPTKLIIGDPRKTAEKIPNLSKVSKVVKVGGSDHLRIQISKDVTVFSLISTSETCWRVEISRN